MEETINDFFEMEYFFHCEMIQINKKKMNYFNKMFELQNESEDLDDEFYKENLIKTLKKSIKQKEKVERELLKLIKELRKRCKRLYFLSDENITDLCSYLVNPKVI